MGIVLVPAIWSCPDGNLSQWGDVQVGRCPSGEVSYSGYRSGTINTRTGRELSRYEFVSVGNCPGGELSNLGSFWYHKYQDR